MTAGLNGEHVAGEKAELVAKYDHLARLKAIRDHALPVLNSERAVQVNISIMRAFVGLRRAAASHAVLSRRLDELERKHGVQ